MNYVVEIPLLGSLILTHTLDGTIEGIERMASFRTASNGHCFLCLQGYGGNRDVDALPGPVELVASLQGQTL